MFRYEEMAVETHRSQAASDGASLLGSEVQWEILLALVKLPQVLASLLVCDGQNAGDGLADSVAIIGGRGE